jgi:2,3,4,5-tetrahydropyridine-2,6-dicarboxylate N-succinyltransferase
MTPLAETIEKGWREREEVPGGTPELRDAVAEALALLDAGKARVAEKIDGQWRAQEWLKKAVLLYFRLQRSRLMPGAHSNFFDKVPLKFRDYGEADFARAGVRVVPDAIVRYGAHVAEEVVLMPCYVNIGAHIGRGSMIDTWATVGSCAQIGANVHISGGVGIGGVLEPVQATPTVIEDDCFIGARSEIVEGVIVERGSVVSMGVFIGQSTKIYDRETGAITYGRVPAGSVVVAGSLPSDDGRYALYAAVIVKQVDAKTRSRVGLNALLRGAD